MDKKHVILVKAIKIFEYPKSMLNKEHPEQDAILRAKSDMQTFCDERINRDFETINHTDFTYEAEELPGYKFRNRQFNDGGPLVSLHKICRRIATMEMEKIHGPLNHSDNAKLYDYIPEVRSKDGSEVLRKEEWYLKEDLENEMFKIYDYYLRILQPTK